MALSLDSEDWRKNASQLVKFSLCRAAASIGGKIAACPLCELWWYLDLPPGHPFARPRWQQDRSRWYLLVKTGGCKQDWHERLGWVWAWHAVFFSGVQIIRKFTVVPVWCTSLLQALSLHKATNSTCYKGANTKMSPFKIATRHFQLFFCCCWVVCFFNRNWVHAKKCL